MAAKRPLIVLDQIFKTFVHRDVLTHALNGVSMELEDGSFVVVRGPSGCGKSTLLSTMGLLEEPSSGRIEVGGVDLSALADWDLARIRRDYFGFVFQNFNLIPNLTVLENVLLPMRLRGQRLTPAMRDRARGLLSHVGISGRERHFPDQLSGGQQQRACVARAMVNEPKVIFADEPTGNLDEASGGAVMDLLADAHGGGATVVLVTHDARFDRVGTKVIYMRDGRIEENGPEDLE